jgi:hypothetical protein
MAPIAIHLTIHRETNGEYRLRVATLGDGGWSRPTVDHYTRLSIAEMTDVACAALWDRLVAP